MSFKHCLLLIAVLVLCVAQVPFPDHNAFNYRKLKQPHLFDSTNWNSSVAGGPASNKTYWAAYNIGSGDGAQALYNRFDRPIFKARDNDSTLALYFGDGSGATGWKALSWHVQGKDWDTGQGGTSNDWPRYTWHFGESEISGMRFSQFDTNDIELSVWNEGLSAVGQLRVIFGLKPDGTLKIGGTNNAVPYATDLYGSSVRSASNFTAQAALAITPVSVSLTADNQTVSTTNRSYILLSSDNGTAGNRTFVLTPSNTAGQILILEWVGTNAGEIADDSANTGGGNNRLSATWTPTQYDKLTLTFNGTDWTEDGRSAN